MWQGCSCPNLISHVCSALTRVQILNVAAAPLKQQCCCASCCCSQRGGQARGSHSWASMQFDNPDDDQVAEAGPPPEFEQTSPASNRHEDAGPHAGMEPSPLKPQSLSARFAAVSPGPASSAGDHPSTPGPSPRKAVEDELEDETPPGSEAVCSCATSGHVPRSSAAVQSAKQTFKPRGGTRRLPGRAPGFRPWPRKAAPSSWSLCMNT